jgi:hypothetical protein
MDISPHVALIGFLALMLIFLALVGLVYVIIGFLPSSPSADPQSVPSDERSPSTHNATSTRYIPSQSTRCLLAFATGLIWFMLWMIFTNDIVAKAFGCAGVSIAVLAIVILCARWLGRRFIRAKERPKTETCLRRGQFLPFAD